MKGTGAGGRRLRAVESTTRLALGFVWIYQGIVPKLVSSSPLEHEIVRRTELYLFSPAATMTTIGALEVVLGAWLLAGRRVRAACLATSALLVLLTILVVAEEPTLLVGPFGGIVKNVVVLVATWTVWFLADPDAP